MTVTLTATGGRYPYALAVYKPANIRATLAVRDGKVLVRIDDVEYIDRWEELEIEAAQLNMLLNDSRPGFENQE